MGETEEISNIKLKSQSLAIGSLLCGFFVNQAINAYFNIAMGHLFGVSCECISPLWILLPSATLLSIVMNIAVGSFKKYL